MRSVESSIGPSSLADRYRVLLDIGRTLTGTLSPGELYRAIYEETGRVLEATGFYISLYDPDTDLARVVYYADRGEENRVAVTYRGSESDVIRTGEATLIDDRADVSSVLVLGEEEEELTRSALSAPLRRKGRVLGAISVQSYRPAAYRREDLELLQGIADIAAVAIENAQHVHELERRRREAEQIEEIGRALTSSLEPQVVLESVMDAVQDLLSTDGATVWFIEDRRARVVASSGSIALPEGLEVEMTGELRQALVEDAAPLLLEDVRNSPQLPTSLREQLESGSALAVPLVAEDRVMGALSAASVEARGFSADDTRVLTRLASQASVALENARLHSRLQSLSLTDPLTGLPNRRHLEIHLSREVAAARRGRELAAVLFDLDNFKQFNDRLGHVAGDEILRVFGEILADETRAMNLAARYGGDEFISVVSDTPVDGVRLHARRISERVEADPHLSSHGITVSYGVARFQEGMEELDDLVHAADEDLYRSKEKQPQGNGEDGTAPP